MAALVDLAVDCANVLGESPIWSGREQRLYWVDIPGRTLSAWEPATQQAPCRSVALPAQVGTIVPRAGGGLLACLEEDIVPVNPDTGVVGLPIARVPAEHRARPLAGSCAACAHVKGCRGSAAWLAWRFASAARARAAARNAEGLRRAWALCCAATQQAWQRTP